MLLGKRKNPTRAPVFVFLHSMFSSSCQMAPEKWAGTIFRVVGLKIMAKKLVWTAYIRPQRRIAREITTTGQKKIELENVCFLQ